MANEHDSSKISSSDFTKRKRLESCLRVGFIDRSCHANIGKKGTGNIIQIQRGTMDWKFQIDPCNT